MFNLPRLDQEEIKNRNRLINSHEIESVTKKLWLTKVHAQIVSQVNSINTEEEWISILKLLQKIFKEAGTLPNSFCKVIITWYQNQRHCKKENYRPIFPMNIDAKILRKNSSRWNSIKHWKDYTTWSEIYSRDEKMVQYLQWVNWFYTLHQEN